jgi:hypothetical protein
MSGLWTTTLPEHPFEVEHPLPPRTSDRTDVPALPSAGHLVDTFRSLGLRSVLVVGRRCPLPTTGRPAPHRTAALHHVAGPTERRTATPPARAPGPTRPGARSVRAAGPIVPR